ncbi:DDE-type integrase/transposase/recombinase [Piscirickettsia litoralis]|uniref:DDE-type integrase/transposase/recombinase n=1 Tax=Piscirickettsia litoralis TaxID=1891921 RepID=UPI001112D0B3
MNGDKYVLWRAVDSGGYELDIFIQKRKNKKSAMRFLKRILGSNPAPRTPHPAPRTPCDCDG